MLEHLLNKILCEAEDHPSVRQTLIEIRAYTPDSKPEWEEDINDKLRGAGMSALNKENQTIIKLTAFGRADTRSMRGDAGTEPILFRVFKEGEGGRRTFLYRVTKTDSKNSQNIFVDIFDANNMPIGQTSYPSEKRFEEKDPEGFEQWKAEYHHAGAWQVTGLPDEELKYKGGYPPKELGNNKLLKHPPNPWQLFMAWFHHALAKSGYNTDRLMGFGPEFDIVPPSGFENQAWRDDQELPPCA